MNQVYYEEFEELAVIFIDDTMNMSTIAIDLMSGLDGLRLSVEGARELATMLNRAADALEKEQS